MATPPKLADRSMAVGLRALNRVAGSSAIYRLGLRDPFNSLLHSASRTTTRTATRAGRSFAAARRLSAPERQVRTSGADLFDLTPSEEQALLSDSVLEFALERLRPAAIEADAACAAPAELLAQAAELGLATLGVPEALGGALTERSATTALLVGEALARGDMGLAVCCLAPGAVATALGLWGDATQQARYLPPFAGDDPPMAGLALMEPEPLADPLAPRTTARTNGDGYAVDGVKALVPRAADAELLVVSARLDEAGSALFVIEAGREGLSVEPDPGLGIRAASTARLVLQDVRLPAGSLLGDGRPEVLRECVALSRLAWCGLALGTGRAVLEYVSDYVRQRRAFGEPIAGRQAVAFTVANIAIELEGMRLVALRAASRADRGLSFEREVALARTLCAGRGTAIGSDGVQLLGGHGYVKEHPVERWYRDLRAAGVMEGALLV
ncbi:MAG: acyl-CoA dehydrogenase family protein [Solirubrobacteraceae bacterium]